MVKYVDGEKIFCSLIWLGGIILCLTGSLSELACGTSVACTVGYIDAAVDIAIVDFLNKLLLWLLLLLLKLMFAVGDTAALMLNFSLAVADG